MAAESELVPVGGEAPDFTLESPGLGPVRLSDYRGREQVLLVFMRAYG
jgi:peroxiredoxin